MRSAGVGLAGGDPAELGAATVAAWDAFVDLAGSGAADLDRPSRLPGWTGRDVLAHLGQWPGRDIVEGVLAAADAPQDAGTSRSPAERDADNQRLVAAHRDTSTAELLAAVARARDSLAGFFASGAGASQVGRTAPSDVGRLPVLSLLHASCYEVAVHALDLAPCGAPAPDPVLLDRGLAALLDVTGALCAAHGIDATVTAQTPAGGWRFTSGAGGWRTEPVPPGPVTGTGVTGSAADLLDTSAGRANLAALLLARRLVVHQLPAFLRLAPLLRDVPGLPGGAALSSAVAGLGGVTRVLGRLRRR